MYPSSPLKPLLVFATALASLSSAVEGFSPWAGLSGGWMRNYDAVEATIGQINKLIPSLTGNDVKLFEDIKAKMQSWDGSSALCDFEEAKQIGEWTRAVNNLASTATSRGQVYRLTKGWLENRIAQCAEQFEEKYRDQIGSIYSAAHLGDMVGTGSDYRYGLWYAFLHSSFTNAQSKYLAGTKWIKFGAKAKARMYFDRVYDEKIVKPCEIIEQMKDATSFGEAAKSITSLPKPYQTFITGFAAAKLGCEKVGLEGKEQIWMETVKGFKDAAKEASKPRSELVSS